MDPYIIYKVLRMVRAFRVFRLFRRLKSLGMILRAIMKSIPAVSNAFALVAGVTSIYAIMVCMEGCVDGGWAPCL